MLSRDSSFTNTEFAERTSNARSQSNLGIAPEDGRSPSKDPDQRSPRVVTFLDEVLEKQAALDETKISVLPAIVRKTSRASHQAEVIARIRYRNEHRLPRRERHKR